MTEQAEKLYLIQNLGGDGYSAGRTRDGRQILFGAFMDWLFAVYFDNDGQLIDVERKPWESLSSHSGMSGRVVDDRLGLLKRLSLWQVEMGIELGTIAVRKFFIPGDLVGIRDLPEHFEEFERDPEGFAEDAEHMDEFREMLKQWRENGNFCLWWSNDYWLQADGELESS
jgi:hypothetical protein